MDGQQRTCEDEVLTLKRNEKKIDKRYYYDDSDYECGKKNAVSNHLSNA